MEISEQQLNALSGAELDKFGRRVAETLQAQFPDAREHTLEDLVPPIRTQVEKAQTYGLTTEYEVATYVVTAWQLGENFDTEFPMAKETLSSEAHTPKWKAEWLAEWTIGMFSKLDEQS